MGRDKSIKHSLETPNTFTSESPEHLESTKFEEQTWNFAFDTDSDSMESLSDSDKVAFTNMPAQPFNVITDSLNPMMM